MDHVVTELSYVTIRAAQNDVAVVEEGHGATATRKWGVLRRLGGEGGGFELEKGGRGKRGVGGSSCRLLPVLFLLVVGLFVILVGDAATRAEVYLNNWRFDIASSGTFEIRKFDLIVVVVVNRVYFLKVNFMFDEGASGKPLIMFSTLCMSFKLLYLEWKVGRWERNGTKFKFIGSQNLSQDIFCAPPLSLTTTFQNGINNFQNGILCYC